MVVNVMEGHPMNYNYNYIVNMHICTKSITTGHGISHDKENLPTTHANTIFIADRLDLEHPVKLT